MNEKVKQAQETLLELSGLALEYLVSNFHFSNKEYPKLKKEIGNLTDKLRLTLNDFDKYYESQQDLIKGKDEYIAKLCCARAELKEQLKQVEDFKYHYDRYKKELANKLKVINCMQEEATTNYNLIEQLENRNDRLVERLEKQKAKLKELTKDNHSLTKTIERLTETDYYFVTSMALDMLKGNSNFALMYVDDIFCLVDTKNNSFEVIDNYDIDTENIGKSKCQELNDLREFAKLYIAEMVDVDCAKDCNTYDEYVSCYGRELNEAQFNLVKKVVEKYGQEEKTRVEK